jgi:hypothetical protein
MIKITRPLQEVREAVLRIRNVNPDPGSEFFHPESDPWSKRSRIRIKVFLTQNIVSELSKMIRDVGPRSLIRIRIFSHPGARGQKSIGSRIWIRNTGWKYPDPYK